MRTALWFPASIGALMLVFAVGGALDYASTGEGFHLIWAAGAGLAAGLVVVFRNFPLIEIEPHRIVSRGHSRVDKVEVGAGDRIAVDGERLFVVRRNGAWEEVQVNTMLIRRSDWAALEAAVARRPEPPGPGG
ncbi:MAG TPA: hypothetical protein VFU12_05475 [Glycomyces sp.]|nr:hypothetical protein [Glycomyces sp.]